VRRALDQLPSRARMALVLRYYADMSYDESPRLSGCAARLWASLLRARHQLREHPGWPRSNGGGAT